MEEHWFDTLNKMLLRGNVPRRVMPRVAAIAIVSHALGTVSFTAAAKNHKKRKTKKKNKRRKKDKGAGTPNPPTDPEQSCSGGACFAAWPSSSSFDLENRNHCEFICEQCVGSNPPRFCILGGTVADCCDVGLTCCGDICVNTWEDDRHCGACNHRCSPGKVCFGGDCLCQEGLTLCGDICRDTNRDENHCGGCNQPCVGPGMRCCNGSCVDTRSDQSHCGACNNSCATFGWTCCDGSCADLDFSESHCGACGASCQPAQLCCHGVGRGCIDSCGGFCTC